MTSLPPPPPPPQRGWPTAPPTRDVPPAWVVPGSSPEFPALPEPTPPDAGTRRTVMLAIAIVAALALLGGVIAVAIGGDDDSVATPPTTSPPTQPSPTAPGPTAAPPTTAAPITEDDLRALVAELSAYVEMEREHEFLAAVEVEVVDDNEFLDRLLADFEDDVDELLDAEVLYRALGLLEPDQSLAGELRALLGAGVVGFHDNRTNEMVVRGTTLSPFVQQTILHELVHALDDQLFELYRPEYRERKDELALGFSSVIEGNASRVASKWLSEQTDEFQEAAAAEQAAFQARTDLSRFPPLIVFQLGAPYGFGELFVDRVVDDRGQRGVDAALTTPPETSEQVIFFDRWLAAEGRVPVPVPSVPGGVDVVDDGVLGALFWLGLFSTGDSSVNPSDTERAVRGWGGDWAITYQAEGQDCVIADIVGDTPADTDEFEATVTAWAVDYPGASVRVVDERVRLESCGAAAGSSNSNL